MSVQVHAELVQLLAGNAVVVRAPRSAPLGDPRTAPRRHHHGPGGCRRVGLRVAVEAQHVRVGRGQAQLAFAQAVARTIGGLQIHCDLGLLAEEIELGGSILTCYHLLRDQLVLVLPPVLTGTVGSPAGWTLLQSKDGTSTRGRAWTKKAARADRSPTCRGSRCG